MLPDKRIDYIRKYYNSIAPERLKWKKRGSYYHESLTKFYRFSIPENKRVLEIGCGTGDLLASVHPSYGVGIDISEEMLKLAKRKYKRLRFIVGDAQHLPIQETFDYVIASDLIGNLTDIQKAFEELRKVSNDRTRIIITYYNYLWEPIVGFAEKFGFKMPKPPQNWLGKIDVYNILHLANLDVVKTGNVLLLPINIPIVSDLVNRFIAKLPVVSYFCLVQYTIARITPNVYSGQEYSVSVIIPARNEKGNIEDAVNRIPKLGTSTEIIFVEGHSRDGTYKEVQHVAQKYRNKKTIRYFKSSLEGKGYAVRLGFAKATGDILIILDADLTVPPAELPKFYHAVRLRKGELIIGTRLVYPMEREAMRFLNILGNKFFSVAFTFLLGQPIKDTLCGTKALFKKDYQGIASSRLYFGDFDPYGDYDLIFGASKKNYKITEIPIRYKARTYGSSNIDRFRHGLLLLKMTIVAALKLKFI